MTEQISEVDFPYFDGKNRRLRYHFDEFLELETRTGVPPTDLAGSIMKLSPANLRLALWVGLKWQEPPGTRKVITLDWVGKQLQKHLATGHSLMPILRAIDEAFTASGYFRPEEGDGDGSAGSPDRPTGAGESSGSPLRVVGAPTNLETE